MPKERTAGDRVGDKFEEKKLSVKIFIENLKYAESHYSRAEVSKLYKFL